MSIWGDRLTALVATLVAVTMAYVGWRFPAGGDIFPKFICGAIVLISAALAARTVSVTGIYDRRRIVVDVRAEVFPLLLTAGFVAYALTIFVLGYYTTTLVFLIGLSGLIGIRSARALFLTTAITLPLLYVFFELFLGADMPAGLLI